MKALYRKYRPTKLSDVIGQERVTKPLENALKNAKFSHAYLFTGPRGCGKTSVARIFAHEVNKFKYEIEDSYVDIIEIDAASNTGVDNIRDLREKAVIAPSEGKYKVYIIDEVHMLSKAAFNALLKTLEEPPKSVIFIMATTDAYKVPVTITSRAQVFNFELAAPDVMAKHLQKIAKVEKIDIADDALDIIVRRGGGSFRDSISLLDQISTLEDGKITKQSVLEALGLPEEQTVENLISAYKEGNITTISNLLKKEIASGNKPEILAENLIEHIISHPEPKTLPLLERLPNVKNPYAEAKILLAFLAEAAEKPVFALQHPDLTATAPAQKPAPKTPEKAPEKEAPAATQPTEPASKTTGPFDWNGYVNAIRSVNAAIGAILEKCQYELKADKLYIYVERKTYRIILNSTNNKRILSANLPPDLSIEFHDNSERLAKNEQVNKISDIMGAVTEVNSNDNPF